MLSPLRDEFLLRFLFREDIFHFHSPVVVFFVCQGCSTRSDCHFNISHRVVWNKICIIDVIKRRGGASKSLRDHQGAPCSQHLNKTKQTREKIHITFAKATVLSVLTCSRHTESILVSNGVIRVLEQKKKKKKKNPLC